ncbi:hypothetical protein M569_04912 [Genlisea aurea]|uniref:DUF4408 domain-containing protein n=1 Tax=Genlisea aurea TaxID=192259 RepID=S8E2J2_9LAMI|nr:hypothetical protein M569_04912 [Genlisea aurea]
MESRMMDRAKVEEEEAMEKVFDRCRGLRRSSSQVLMLLLMVVSWSSIAVLRNSSFEVPACLFNHHVVFLIWNAIAVVLFVLCRETSRNVDRAAAEESPAAESIAKDPTKDEDAILPRNDDVSAAIETAARQIEKFQKTQSAKLKQRIVGARHSLDLRRPETDHCLIITTTREEIETLSSDEFRRRVDAFIDAHWRTRKIQPSQISA